MTESAEGDAGQSKVGRPALKQVAGFGILLRPVADYFCGSQSLQAIFKLLRGHGENRP